MNPELRARLLRSHRADFVEATEQRSKRIATASRRRKIHTRTAIAIGVIGLLSTVVAMALFLGTLIFTSSVPDYWLALAGLFIAGFPVTFAGMILVTLIPD